MAVFKTRTNKRTQEQKDNNLKANYKKDNWTVKIDYIDWNRKKKTFKKEGFKTQKEAKAFEREFIDKVNANSDMLFASLIKHYYEFIDNRLKPTTLENKRYLIDLKILPFFGDMKLTEVEPATVMKWQNELIAQEYSPTYLKSIHNQLSAIFNFAMKFYNHNSNPARVCGSMGRKNAEAMDFYTLEEFNRFIESFEDDITLKLIFEIFFYTGIRIGELLALTPSDFKFDKNTMVIDENFQRVKKQTVIQSPKTYTSKRSITLPEELFLSIQEYISKLYGIEEDEFIFNLSKSHIGNKLKKGAEKANLKKIRVHDLRHSHASFLIHLGFPPLIVSERLGHKDIKTTLQTYSHLYPNKDVEVANTLNDFLKNPQKQD